MKKDLLFYYLLLACIVLTILGEKVVLSYLFKYGNMIALICIGIYFFISSIGRIIQSEYSHVSIEIFSGIIIVFTSAFLAIFQSIHNSDFLTVIKILTIINGIYPIYLIIRFKDKTYSVRHFIISSLLMGVGICF
jgi:hypothetical protein